MKIITAPHRTLRTVATPIASVTPALKQLVENLGKTLQNASNPQGVGLAAPQVDSTQRLFATYLPDNPNDDQAPARPKLYINPSIVDHSDKRSFGPDKKHPTLEGCLSIPGLYGPVPRWDWITLSYFELVGDELQARQSSATDFAARVIQHEFDHLEGVLFTDYSLHLDLPVYQENKRTKELEELENRSLLELL